MSCTYSAPADIGECNKGDPNYWCNHNCFRAYDNVYNNANGILGFSTQGLENSQGQVEELVQNVTRTQGSLGNMTDNIVALCLQTTTPGICDTFLTSYCPNVTLDREGLSTRQSDIDLCGCYVPPDPSLNVPDACQPLCNLATTVRKAQNGVRDTCPANVCIIDNVTIRSRDSGANVNFTNICPGCRVGEDTNCICVVNASESSSVNDILGTVGITTNVTQFCGPQSLCTTINPDGTTTTTSCDSAVGNVQPNGEEDSYPWAFFIFLGLFLLVVLIVFIFTRGSR